MGPGDRNPFLISVRVFFFAKHLFTWNRQHKHSFLKDHFHSWRSFKKTAYNWQYSHYYFYQYDCIHFNYTSLELKWQITLSGNHRTNWKMFQFLCYMELLSLLSPTLKWLIFLSNLNFHICQQEVQDLRQEDSTRIFIYFFKKWQTVFW